MAIKHEALIDLELSLSRSLSNEWRRRASKLLAAIQKAVDRKDFSEADRLVDELEFTTATAKKGKVMDTVAVSAVMLGTSRLGSPSDAALNNSFPREMVDNAIQQYVTMMEENAQEGIRLQGHMMVANAEQLERETVYKAEYPVFNLGLKAVGSDFYALGANLMTSRLNSLGFLAEATIRNISTYQINEVMDSRTCPVCQEMDGKVFTVEEGFNQVMQALSTNDPNALKFIAPWPRQDKASVARLAQMGSNDMAAAGLATPPYHPSCRGIVDVTTSTDRSDALIPTITGALSGGALAALMFGGETEEDIEVERIPEYIEDE